MVYGSGVHSILSYSHQGDLVSIRNLLDIFSILLHSSVDEEELNDDSNLLSSEGDSATYISVSIKPPLI